MSGHTIAISEKPINNIPFIFLAKKEKMKQAIESSNKPCFLLYFNSSWNDYGMKNNYRLYYYDGELNYHELGYIKIISKLLDSSHEVIPERFYQLSSELFSLGQSKEYYTSLKKSITNTEVILNTLNALNDISINKGLIDEIENLSQYKNSLIRHDQAEQLIRTAENIILGNQNEASYSFEYSFKPINCSNEEPITINFNFDKNLDLPRRIFALIGKNGVGKTQLLTSIPKDICELKRESLSDRNSEQNKIPNFSKVIAVSYGIFDNFEIPEKNNKFSYKYCGIRKNGHSFYSREELVENFSTNIKTTKFHNRYTNWFTILGNLIDTRTLFEIERSVQSISELNPDYSILNEILKKLSSGQSILLFIITDLISSIRYDSLIIFDEPETHLHPNAISQLINAIYSITNYFDSYCIIATHSPLIIRNILSDNIYILEKNDTLLNIRKPLSETFGESLSILSEEVFKDKDIPKQFIKIINKLAEEGKSEKEIENMITSDERPLNLSISILISSLANND